MKPFSYVGILLLLLTGCDTTPQHRAVYVLVDTSATYAQELEHAHKVINYLLGVLEPGDSLAIARIDSESFSEQNVIASITFSNRPSQVNNEKRQLQQKFSEAIQKTRGSAYTDISGGLLQAASYLKETGAKQRYLFVFSDLAEDLKRGQIRDFKLDLKQTHVIAVHVTKLKSDNKDPAQYQQRINNWRQRIEASGASWQVINDLSRLDRSFLQ